METTFLDHAQADAAPSPTWVRRSSPEVRTYELIRDGEAEPEIVHIFTTGFKDLYTLVFEDGYDNAGARTEYLSAARIFSTYNIKID